MKHTAPGGVPALVAAFSLHGLALGALLVLPSPTFDVSRRPPVRIRIAPRPKPRQPEPNPEPKVEPKPTPKPEPQPTPRPTRRPRPVKRVEPPPPAPAPPAPAPAPRTFSVSMEVTVSSGRVAVPTSPAPSKRGSPAGSPKGQGGSAQEPVPVSELTELPRLLSQPTQGQMRAAYPEAARRDGLEADVRLRLLVGKDGRVAEVRIVGRAGQGFDEVAVRLVNRFRFRPGRRGGTAVPVWIPWTYKFRLRD